jgi:hypothetical protein
MYTVSGVSCIAAGVLVGFARRLNWSLIATIACLGFLYLMIAWQWRVLKKSFPNDPEGNRLSLAITVIVACVAMAAVRL